MGELITAEDVRALTNATLPTSAATDVDLLIAEIEAAMKALVIDWTQDDSAAHTFDGRGYSALYLGRWLRTPTLITIDGGAVDPANVVNLGYALVLKSGAWPEGVGNVYVEGDFGFLFEPPVTTGDPVFNPGGTVAYPDAPAEPRSEMTLLARIMARQLLPDYFQPETTGESVGGMSFSYEATVEKFNQTRLARAMIDRFRGPAIG